MGWSNVENSQFHNLFVCSFYRSDFMVNLSNFIMYIKLSIEETLGLTNIVILVVDINIDYYV